MVGMIVALIIGLLGGGFFGIITLGLAISSGMNRDDEMEYDQVVIDEETISWEKFLEKQRDCPSHYEPTNIRCPNCGKLIHRDTSVVLTSYPAQHRYECFECGWKGTA